MVVEERGLASDIGIAFFELTDVGVWEVWATAGPENIQPVEVCHKDKGDWERIDLPAETLQIRDLREFAACIAGKKEPDFSLDHDLSVQEALLKASGMAS